MQPKPTEESIRYVIRQLNKGRNSKIVAEEMNVTQRHVQRLWASYRKTGTIPMLGKAGRPKGPEPSEEKVQTVLDAYHCRPEGVLRTAKRLRRDGYDIIYAQVCAILKPKGLITASSAKSKQRKWARYERPYSNAMWHTDWHTMKDPRMNEQNLITCLGYASRCVTEAALFSNATSENAVKILRLAIDRFGVPVTILSDDGSCFIGAGCRKKSGGFWTPTSFESKLLALNMGLINSRPYRPQTNGKLEWFHESIENKIGYYDNLEDYIEYYNTDRLH